MIPFTWLPVAIIALVQIALAPPLAPSAPAHPDIFLHDPPVPVRPDRDPDEVGIASRYGGPKDSRWGGAALACAPATHTDLEMHVCAHRTYRCGTVLVLESVKTGKQSTCRVMDRGPFGAMHEGKWRVKIRRHEPGVWRGVLDTTPAVFAELGLRGLSPVRIWVVDVPARPLRIRKPRPKGNT